MIVTCPACEVNYRLPSVALEARDGRCSRCDLEFPLPTRPSYRMVPALVGGADLLATTAPAVTDWPDMPAISSAAPGNDDIAAKSATGEVPDVPARSAANSILGGIAAMVLATGGATAGYYLSSYQGADLVSWTAVGAAVGLTLAWVTIRWTRSKR